jgi:hypothetical protein
VGQGSKGDYLGDGGQRNRLLDAFMRFGKQSPRVKGVLLHRLVDSGEAGNFGVLTGTFAPKPAYCDFAAKFDLVPPGCSS